MLIVTIFPIQPLPHPRGQRTGPPAPCSFIGAWLYSTSRRQAIPDRPQSHWRNERHAPRQHRRHQANQVLRRRGRRSCQSFNRIIGSRVRDANLTVMKAWAVYSPTMSFSSTRSATRSFSRSGPGRSTHHGLDNAVLLEFFTIIWAPLRAPGQTPPAQPDGAILTGRRRTGLHHILDEEDEIHATDGVATDSQPDARPCGKFQQSRSFSYAAINRR